MGDDDNGPFGVSDMGDSIVPIYRFDWEDGSRRTDEIEDYDEWPDAIRELADIAQEDPDCEVSLVGFGS